MKRILSVIVGITLLALPALALGAGTGIPYDPIGDFSLRGELVGDMNSYIGANMPMRTEMVELNLSIRALGGQKEYNQVLICGDELIQDVDPPLEDLVRRNTASIKEFAGNVGIPTYCMIIPTASAIRQQSLPPFAQTQMVNQKQIIEDIYSDMVGRVTVVDAYRVLFNARESYLYYRTEHNLTALGGFYLYSVLGPRLLEGMVRPSLSDYDIEYVKSDYYGGLYNTSPFKDARADSVFIYHYTRNPREYIVTKWQDRVAKTYHTIYPGHLPGLGREMDVYLGGLSSITRVETNSPYRASLLVFGDKTALAYLPFIVNHYSSVTLVDLFQLDSAGYASLSLLDYDQALFAYGIETFMHSNYPARATRLLDSLSDQG